MKIGRWKNVVAGTTGSEVAEAALVLPLAFLLLLGIYWFGRAFNVYATINHAAREGARVAVASTCASCGNTAATSNPAAIASVVTTALQASGVDPSKITVWSSPTFCSGNATSNCNTPSSNNNITICTQVQLAANANPGSGPPVCGVSVSFQYPYRFSLPYPASGVNLQLKADVQMSGEN